MLHDLPAGSSVNVFTSPHAHLDFIAILLSWLFFEGKMRGLFSMLFGAGVILLTSRAERRGSRNVADIYTRRNMWLMLFGLLHGCLIWDGDILFDYAAEALLFLYPFRRLRAKTLLWTGTLLSLFIAPIGINLYVGAVGDYLLHYRFEQAQHRQQAHLPFTVADREHIAAWNKLVQKKAPSPQKTAEALAEGRAPYWTATASRTTGLIAAFGKRRIGTVFDAVPAMLLGMGLMKIGFFSLELETSTYLWSVLIGFTISLPLYALGVVKAYAAHFDFFTAEAWLFAPYYITREAGAVAIAAVILLFIRYGVLGWLQRALAAVGRTAFSNYILTSLMCQTLFVWGPHPLFGKLDFYQLMLVALAIWVFNLVASSLWLRGFAYGPLEWLWRSLTYWKRQPMLLRNEAR